MYKVTDRKSDRADLSKNHVFLQGYCDHCGGKTNGFWTLDPNFWGSCQMSDESNHDNPFDCVKHLRSQLIEIAKLHPETYHMVDFK